MELHYTMSLDCALIRLINYAFCKYNFLSCGSFSLLGYETGEQERRRLAQFSRAKDCFRSSILNSTVAIWEKLVLSPRADG